MKKVIYLAGGCFWGLEHLYNSLDGVIEAISGYSNGTNINDAKYEIVKKGETGFKETVKVIYDPSIITLKFILYAYFYVINPEVQNRQGNDIGTQYQVGIYYEDDEDINVIQEIYELEKSRHKKFFVEFHKINNFYEAEEYYQHYLDKNPNGYCHIPFKKIDELRSLMVDPSIYNRPSDLEIKNKLSDLSYEVTQNKGTEYPFYNEYYKEFNKGIYVDIVTGEPLFLSTDKYLSSCGWPSFTKPIEEPTVVKLLDDSHNMIRVEVRSRVGDSHLGHVFQNDPESPNGIRYCINSASLKFIPYDKMDEEGYSKFKKLLDE